MQAEVWGWLATGILAPIVAVSLSWTLLVFHCHRKKWRPLDLLFVSILVQIILKQCGAFAHTVLELLRPEEAAWCSGLSWLFTTSHTMEAGLLTTLSLGSLLQNKMDNHLYRRTFSKSHLIYHVTCLFILSTCVGIAGVIAKQNACSDRSDKRYVIFWLTLHSALIVISFICFLTNCLRKDATPKHSCFANSKNHCTQLLNSSSDLSSAVSDVSMLSSNRSRINHGIRYSISDCSTSNIIRSRQNLLEEFMKSPSTNFEFTNSSDSKLMKNLSASQMNLPNTLDSSIREFSRIPEEANLFDRSDTSRCDIDSSSYSTIHRPCRESCYTTSTSSASASSTNSRKRLTKQVSIEENMPLYTIVCIVTYCYMIHHIPNLIAIVSEIYVSEYLPSWWKPESFPYWTAIAEGMLFPIILLLFDKQFSLRIAQIYSRQTAKRKLRETPPDMTSAGIYGKFRPYNSTLLEPPPKPPHRRSTEGVRFPITNGSLFASPNNRNQQPGKNLNVHSKGIRTTSNVLSPTPLSVNSQLYANIMTAVEITNCNMNKAKAYPKHTSFSQYSGNEPNFSIHGSSNELDRMSPNTYKTNPIYSQNLQQFKEKFFNEVIIENNDASDSEDDEKPISNTGDDDIYATLSNHSLCSATTDANDDFEFYNSETNIEKYNDKLSENKVDQEVETVKEVKKEEEESVPKPIIRVHKKREPEKQNCRIYRLSEPPLLEAPCTAANNYIPRQFYKTPLSRNTRIRFSPPNTRRLLVAGSPPPSRRILSSNSRRLAPVLSMDSLIAAINYSDVSYLDTGDVMYEPKIHPEYSGSVPDLKKIFVTDYL
ncbi:hypothetical protein M8J76_012264 [Diaphorina citri]|nr:hypothetical protein M8J75_001926 [Diaphorina citri]KAI5750030.1 hypothetical protein M8J76_012264 [Diaphorina citri]